MTSQPWPIFIVSLVDAAARRAAIHAQLARRGLTAEMVDAVDGRRGLPPVWHAEVDRPAAQNRIGRPISEVELACGLSHRTVYRMIIARGLPGAIVLEDDAVLTPLFDTFIAAQGYLAADLVQMDHLDARVRRGSSRLLAPGIAVHRLVSNASLTTGYSISRRGAQHVLACSTPLAGLADWPCDMVALGALVTVPRIVDHPPDTAGSEIETARRRLVDANPGEPQRWKRFSRRAYWVRWWFKRRSRKIS